MFFLNAMKYKEYIILINEKIQNIEWYLKLKT